jgi:hypothetical protein
LARRPKATDALIAKVLDILDRPSSKVREHSDKVPHEYVSFRRKYAGKRTTRGRES